jgi:hypothetical protein
MRANLAHGRTACTGSGARAADLHGSCPVGAVQSLFEAWQGVCLMKTPAGAWREPHHLGPVREAEEPAGVGLGRSTKEHVLNVVGVACGQI